MLLASSAPLNQMSQTFTSNATWTAPATTSLIPSMTGKGGTGSSAYSTPGAKTVLYEHVFYKKAGGADYTSSSGTWSGTTQPADIHTMTYIGDTSGTYDYDEYFVTYDQAPSTSPPATTGGSTTGFGQTFVGGYAGPATASTIPNIAVTPSANYTIVVPSGGSLTIVYFQ